MKAIKLLFIATLSFVVVACSGGVGENGAQVSAVTSSDLSSTPQLAVPNQVNSCFSITNTQVSLAQWWTSGSFNITNSCSTVQAINGQQIMVTSQGFNLVSGDFSLNSVSGITFPAPVYWAATTMSMTSQLVGSYTSLGLQIKTDPSGVIAPNASATVSFGYNPHGITPGALTFSIANSAPVQTGTINLSINATSLKSVCNSTTPCNIPVYLVGQGTTLSTLVATITQNNVGSVITSVLTKLNPATYTLTVSAGSLPSGVTFSASPITLTSGATVNASGVFAVQVATTGSLSVTLNKPSGFIRPESYVGASLLNAANGSVGAANLYFGTATVFTSILAGNYTLKSYGLGDAISGVYYNPINQAVTISAGKTTTTSLQLVTNTSSLVTGSLVVTGLESGDLALITLTDNYNGSYYKYNSFSVGNGATVLHLLSGDSITLNVSVNSKYIAINPSTYNVGSSTLTVTLPFVKVPAVTKVYSAYKDIGINANWNTDLMSTTVGSSNGIQPLVANLPATMPAITWAFATGECGQENWAGMDAVTVAQSNIPPFITYNKQYIISTGGAAGIFTCSSDAGMLTFVQRYMSVKMIGIDFDMEGGQSPQQVTSLVKELKYIQGVYPNLRISFTLATLASTADNANVNALGDSVIKAANAVGLNYIVDLMVMDYGAANSYVCVVVNGNCQMGQSAIQAAVNVNRVYGIPFSRIELTPMIGINDVMSNIFTLDDATNLAKYVAQNGLAGIHYWSYDRDTPCPVGQSYVSSLCTSIPGVTTQNFSFANAFYYGLANQ